MLEEHRPTLLVEVTLGVEDKIFGYLKDLGYRTKLSVKKKDTGMYYSSIKLILGSFTAS